MAWSFAALSDALPEASKAALIVRASEQPMNPIAQANINASVSLVEKGAAPLVGGSSSLDTTSVFTDPDSILQPVTAFSTEKLNIDGAKASTFSTKKNQGASENIKDVSHAAAPRETLQLKDGVDAPAEPDQYVTLSATKKIVKPMVLDLNRFPWEIRNRILEFAMTAEKGRFDFTDLRSKNFKPNVNTALLRTNREVYHEAQEHLHNANVFIFTGCGSDFRILTQPSGLHSCPVSCSSAFKTRRFRSVIFDLGDDISMETGELKAQCFIAALEGLRSKVDIKHLTVHFRYFCWGEGVTPEELANSLRNINVTETMVMFGPDFHWRTNLRLIPGALGMNVHRPRSWSLVPGGANVGFQGTFQCQYIPAKCIEETTDKGGESIFDPGFEYEKIRSGEGI